MRPPGYVLKRRHVVISSLNDEKEFIGQELWLKVCGEHIDAFVDQNTGICDQCWEEGRYRYSVDRAQRASNRG